MLAMAASPATRQLYSYLENKTLSVAVWIFPELIFSSLVATILDKMKYIFVGL